MTRVFETAAAAERISKLLNCGGPEVASRVELRRTILQIVCGAGFDRARFYERCADLGSRSDHILVLVAEENASGKSERSHLAKCIPAKKAATGFDESSAETVFRHQPSDFDPPPEWIEELDLGDRVWADVNLRVVGKSVGAIAVDWKGSKDDLGDTDQRLLAGIGTMVAQHLEQRPPERLHRFREAIEVRGGAEVAATQGQSPVTTLLDEALLASAEILDARLAALFEYHWSSGELQKTREYDSAIGRRRWDPEKILVLSEDYPVGKNLTGRAWGDPTYRHVPDFERESELLEDLVDKESKLRHTEYMGEAPSTCLYGRIESMEPRYMIRLMNRGESRGAPYVGEQVLLREILEELRAEVDKATALGRTASLEHATRLGADIVDPHAMLAELGTLLEQEDVTDAIVLCHRRHSDQFGFCGVHGELFRKPGQGFTEWREDRLYHYLIEREDLELVDRYAAKRVAASSIIGREVLSQVSGFLVIRLAAGDTTGVMLIPVKPGHGLTRKNLYEECGVGRLSLLKAYGSLLADVIDSAVARARADGARRALGVLGHELATPLARLGGVAQSALNEIRNTTIEADEKDDGDRVDAMDRIRSASVGYREQIQVVRRSIGTAMSLAPLVAQESDNGRLELQMRPCNLGTLTLRAIEQAQLEADDYARRLQVDGEQRTPPNYVFIRKDSVLELGRIVGDPGFLHLTILNVLRNAFKYSIPSPQSNSCKITVSGLRQKGMKIVLVENLGRGIEPETIDHIFEPWVRLEDDRDSTARTGMGIGLFFSRRIAVAHSGTVLCSGSEAYSETELRPEVDSREARLERMLQEAKISGRGSQRRRLPTLEPEAKGNTVVRYKTTFEIRLADSLLPGPYIHEWTPGFTKATTRRRNTD